MDKRQLTFTKMHGAGNDFIILDNRDGTLATEDIVEWAPELCDRRYGIGADGIMALHAPENPSLDYTMLYRNADGSDAGMCGNGARCLALYAARAGLGPKLTFNVHETIYEAAVNEAERYVTIAFPMDLDITMVQLPGEEPLAQLHAGTEHIVLETDADTFADNEVLRTRGRALRNKDRFDPPGTNVNFIRGEGPEIIRIKTYEKGVENLTLACGTGAIAGALAWHNRQQQDQRAHPVEVHAEGGTLKVDFSYDSKNDRYSGILLSGEARFVFEGKYAL